MVKVKVLNENTRAKFERLATERTRKVMAALRVLGNCSNRNQYEYNQADISKIFGAIEKEVKKTKAKFHAPDETIFSLK